MKNLLFAATFILLATLGFGQSCTNLHVSISPDGQQLYFISNRHGSNYEIYRMNIDGTNLKRLTNTSVDNYYPSINPAGDKVVFQRGSYGSSAEVWIMDTSGANEIQLTNNSGHDGYASFSPDGNTIIFEAWDGSSYPEVFTMDLNGSNRTQITNESGAYWQSGPVYNPSGTKIIFQRGYNADNHYVKMDLNGTNWVNITDPNAFGIAEAGLDFSPDGQKIAFMTTEYVGYNNGSDIVVADTTGANWVKLTNSTGGQYFYYPVFHPNGQWIYYPCDTTGDWHIYHMDTNGTNPVKVSNCFGVGIQSKVSMQQIAAVPNPATAYIVLKLPTMIGKGEYNLLITDALGRQIQLDVDHVGDRIQMNTDDLLQGIYFFRIEIAGASVFSGKFIVQ